MSKESNNKPALAEPMVTATEGINQSNSFSSPIVRTVIIMSALTMGVSAGNSNNKAITGINNAIIEYADSNTDKIPSPSYKISGKEYMPLSHTKRIIGDTKDYALSLYTPDIVSQKIISDSRKEIAMLKNRLRNSLPVHTLVYMIISSAVGAIAITLIVLRFAGNVYTIDPYYLFCALIISITLFFTALISLKDWKDFLNERS